MINIPSATIQICFLVYKSHFANLVRLKQSDWENVCLTALATLFFTIFFSEKALTNAHQHKHWNNHALERRCLPNAPVILSTAFAFVCFLANLAFLGFTGEKCSFALD